MRVCWHCCSASSNGCGCLRRPHVLPFLNTRDWADLTRESKGGWGCTRGRGPMDFVGRLTGKHACVLLGVLDILLLTLPTAHMLPDSTLFWVALPYLKTCALSDCRSVLAPLSHDTRCQVARWWCLLWFTGLASGWLVLTADVRGPSECLDRQLACSQGRGFCASPRKDLVLTVCTMNDATHGVLAVCLMFAVCVWIHVSPYGQQVLTRAGRQVRQTLRHLPSVQDVPWAAVQKLDRYTCMVNPAVCRSVAMCLVGCRGCPVTAPLCGTYSLKWCVVLRFMKFGRTMAQLARVGRNCALQEA